MENSAQESDTNNSTHLINSFTEITSATKEEAVFFLESHQWDLDAAVSTFLDNPFEQQQQPVNVPPATNNSSPSHSDSQLSPQSPPWVPMRSRSPSPSPTSRPQYELRSRRGSGGESRKLKTRAGGIRTLADLNSAPLDESGSDDDEPQEYYTGGEKSGMLVQDPTRGNSVDAIFDQARQSAVDPSDLQRPSSSRAFSGTARLLSGETVSSAPSHPEVVSHNITFWRNGFTIDDGPLRRFDDPANASFMESIRRSECPRELEPADKRTRVQVELNRREEDYSEPPKRRSAFQGVGRTVGSNTTTTTDPPASDASAAADSFKSAPPPSTGLVVDKSLPTTSIQLRLADGTRMVSRFNFHHTIRDVHAFIDASRPGGTRNYQLQAMGFPPKQLTDLDQTIEQAGIANSVVIQKF